MTVHLGVDQYICALAAELLDRLDDENVPG